MGLIELTGLPGFFFVENILLPEYTKQMRNMKNYILITSIAICVGFVSHAQSRTAFLSPLFTSQKAYVNTQVKEKQRSKYLACINYSNVLLPRIYDEIQKLDTSFWNNPNQTNILEYFSSYGNLKGEIWKSNSIYYSYLLDADKKLIVQGKSISDLETSHQTIIQNFSNWSTSVFSNNGQALGSPTDHPFYLAAKVSTDSVYSIGFYY